MQGSDKILKYEIGGRSIEFVAPGERLIQAYSQQPERSGVYWARVWPAAIGLCHFLSKEPDYIKDKLILELAGGLGLPGLFASAFAKEVIITDIAPEAIKRVSQSIKHNKLANVQCMMADWNEPRRLIMPDILLLSDVNYEPGSFESLLKAIMYFLDNKVTILLSTPQRLMGKDFITQLLVYCKKQVVEEIEMDGTKADISIFVLQKGKPGGTEKKHFI